jgi:hypothetical protein
MAISISININHQYVIINESEEIWLMKSEWLAESLSVNIYCTVMRKCNVAVNENIQYLYSIYEEKYLETVNGYSAWKLIFWEEKKIWLMAKCGYEKLKMKWLFNENDGYLKWLKYNGYSMGMCNGENINRSGNNNEMSMKIWKQWKQWLMSM